MASHRIYGLLQTTQVTKSLLVVEDQQPQLDRLPQRRVRWRRRVLERRVRREHRRRAVVLRIVAAPSTTYLSAHSAAQSYDRRTGLTT